MVEEGKKCWCKSTILLTNVLFQAGRMCACGNAKNVESLFTVSLKKPPNFGILALKPIGLLTEAR